MYLSENEQELSLQEKLFCCFYVELSNPIEAAVAAGYKSSEAFTLLFEPKIKRFIKKSLKNREKLMKEGAKAALMRLAFGRTNDIAALAFSEEVPKDIDALDLFCISEIKKVKGGGVEIKLADRLEAIKMLCELEEKSKSADKTDSFFDALKNTAPSPAGDDSENG